MGFAHGDSCFVLNKREVNSRGRFPTTRAGWEPRAGGIKRSVGESQAPGSEVKEKSSRSCPCHLLKLSGKVT